MFFCPLGCQNKIKTEACCWTSGPRLTKPGKVWAINFSGTRETECSSLCLSTCRLGWKHAIREILDNLDCMIVTVLWHHSLLSVTSNPHWRECTVLKRRLKARVTRCPFFPWTVLIQLCLDLLWKKHFFPYIS